MRIFVLVAAVCLSACSWFASRKAPALPDPTEIVVTGAPARSVVFLDGVPSGQAAEHNDQSQILEVSPGDHKVEIHLGDTVVYRETTYVGLGERRIVIVLSGSAR